MADPEKQPTPPTPPAPAEAPSAEPESLDTPTEAGSSTPAPATSGIGEPKQGKDPKGSGLKGTFNVYFILFIVVVLAAIGVIYYAVTIATQSKPKTNKVNSLTSAELAQLKANTTVVGDTKSTLDIQSNAVFDGQVLARNDFTTSANIKVGGTASLKDLVVNGTSTLGNVNISGNTQLSGDTTIQGALSILKGLTVSGAVNIANLNAGQVTVNSIQLTGDFNVSRHITTSGNAVNRTLGTALGGGGTASISGNDTAGTVNINTGNSPVSGLFVNVKFARPFATTPHVIVTPIGSAAGLVKYYVNRDGTGFSIGTTTAPPAGSSFAFDYFVVN